MEFLDFRMMFCIFDLILAVIGYLLIRYEEPLGTIGLIMSVSAIFLSIALLVVIFQ